MPSHPNFNQTAMQRSALYLPLVGLLVGSLVALVYLLCTLLWSAPVAVVLSLVASLLLTGGFHEDGLADSCDGLGGAFNKASKLAIMKDSRLGSYGALALWAALTLKVILLSELLPAASIGVLIVAHSLSRWAAMLAMVRLPYVREQDAKAQAIVQQLSARRWCAAGLFCLPPLLFAGLIGLVLIAATLVTTLLWHRLLKRQIGGYTGDTIGASQQLNELVIYLVWLAAV